MDSVRAGEDGVCARLRPGRRGHPFPLFSLVTPVRAASACALGRAHAGNPKIGNNPPACTAVEVAIRRRIG